jgi:hypothetical protein
MRGFLALLVGSVALSGCGSDYTPGTNAVELFVDRHMAELMVENWDRDEPDRADELYVEPVEPETSPN